MRKCLIHVPAYNTLCTKEVKAELDKIDNFAKRMELIRSNIEDFELEGYELNKLLTLDIVNGELKSVKDYTREQKEDLFKRENKEVMEMAKTGKGERKALKEHRRMLRIIANEFNSIGKLAFVIDTYTIKVYDISMKDVIIYLKTGTLAFLMLLEVIKVNLYPDAVLTNIGRMWLIFLGLSTLNLIMDIIIRLTGAGKK